MGLFDKKYCDVYGEKIGILGNRKLEDGNLCKNCAGKLSPFFSERRSSTVEEIREQLAYRKANQEQVDAFNPTKVLGGDMKIYFDGDRKQWLASRARSWRGANPDVLSFSQVMGCDVDADESKRELKRKNPEGKEVSYVPPRYEYSYDFYVTIHVNSPWFSQIRFQVNDDEIHQRGGIAYREAQKNADEIRQALLQVRDAEREAVLSCMRRSRASCALTAAPRRRRMPAAAASIAALLSAGELAA